MWEFAMVHPFLFTVMFVWAVFAFGLVTATIGNRKK